MVNVGDKAPDFNLKDQHDNDVKLSSLRGKKVLLAFYPFDWSPVCTTEMACFKDDLSELKGHGLDVLAISVDSVWSHKAWAKAMNVTFPLLSDFGKETVRHYGLLRAEGFSERAYLLVDEHGVVKWKHVMPSPGERIENSEIVSAINHAK